jgi:hypothetical protein
MIIILQIKNIGSGMDFNFAGNAILWYKDVAVMVWERDAE